MTKLPLSLLLVLLNLGTFQLPAAEPEDSLTPDPQDSITESVTEHGVTLTLTCPKILRPGLGTNYILMTVRNDRKHPVNFLPKPPRRLGIDFAINTPGKRQQWGIVSVPEIIIPLVLESGEEYKVLAYPIQYYPFLQTGKLEVQANWQVFQVFGMDDRVSIHLTTKPIAFEYQGQMQETAP